MDELPEPEEDPPDEPPDDPPDEPPEDDPPELEPPELDPPDDEELDPPLLDELAIFINCVFTCASIVVDICGEFIAVVTSFCSSCWNLGLDSAMTTAFSKAD